MRGDKVLQALGIQFSALAAMVFGMMILSFPVGAYVVFSTGIGDEINYEYPLRGLDLVAWAGAWVPAGLEVGDAFIVAWSTYAVVFAVAMSGPRRGFLRELTAVMNGGRHSSSANHMVSAIRWFAVLVAASAAINLVQESAGIATEPPPSENDLIRFLGVSWAPISEEIGFRVLLIGVPLYVIYSHRASAGHLFRSLWRPYEGLRVSDYRKAAALIVLSAAFFGVAHVASGEAWSGGKLAQASTAGVIIGWVYFRHGFAPALLIHWATNYLVFSYVYLVSDIGIMTVDEAFSHTMLQTFEIIFLATGAVSVAMMAIRQLRMRAARS